MLSGRSRPSVADVMPSCDVWVRKDLRARGRWIVSGLAMVSDAVGAAVRECAGSCEVRVEVHAKVQETGLPRAGSISPCRRAARNSPPVSPVAII